MSILARDPKNIAASWRYIVSPRVINEFIFGHSEFTFDFISPQAEPGQIFFQGGDGGGTVSNNLGAGDAPVIVRNLSYAIGNLRTIRTRQFVDNLTFIKGAHTFKRRVNLRYVQHADVRGGHRRRERKYHREFQPDNQHSRYRRVRHSCAT